MITTHKGTRYVAAILCVTLVCCMFCISSVGAAETPKSLLQNPFSSSKPTSSGGASTGTVVAPASQSSAASADSCRITLQADRSKVYYQAKIQFDAKLVKTGTNAPVAGTVITFQNVNDSSDTRKAVTNSQGKAVAGAYARLEPPQSEQWIATAVVDGMECSSRPVSIQVTDYYAPTVTSDALIYTNPFSTGGILPAYAVADWFWPYSYYNPALIGFLNPSAWSFESGDWTIRAPAGLVPGAYSYYPYSYYPYWSTYSSDARPFFSAVAATSPFPIWY